VAAAALTGPALWDEETPRIIGGGFKGSAQFLGESSRLVDSTEEWGWLRGSRWNSDSWPGG
jgi:hypothetical protein